MKKALSILITVVLGLGVIGGVIGIHAYKREQVANHIMTKDEAKSSLENELLTSNIDIAEISKISKYRTRVYAVAWDTFYLCLFDVESDYMWCYEWKCTKILTIKNGGYYAIN